MYVSLNGRLDRIEARVDCIEARANEIDQRLARLEGQAEMLLRSLHIEVKGGGA